MMPMGHQERSGTGTALCPSLTRSAAPGWRLPGCPGLLTLPASKVPVPAGERWHAGPCPALSCPGHPRAPRGLPRAALAAGWAVGRAGTLTQPWRQTPGTALCVPHVGLGSGGGHAPHLYLWGGWGTATCAQVALKGPRKRSAAQNLGVSDTKSAVAELGTRPGDAPSLGKGWWVPQGGKMSGLRDEGH